MIYLIAGHSLKDPGAINTNYKGKTIKEADLTRRVRDGVTKELLSIGVPVRNDESIWSLSETMNWLFKKSSEKDIIIDFHFDSASSEDGRGTSAFISSPYTLEELTLADELVNCATSVLGTKKRGMEGGRFGVNLETKTRHTRLGILRPKGINVLIEICFISSTKDMELFFINELSLYRQMALKISSFANSIK